MSFRPFSSRLLVAAALLLGLCAPAAAKKPPPQSYGRPPAKAKASHALDWPFRVLAFPVWAVTELVLRQPLGLGVRALERSETVQKAQDGSSEGPLKQLTILPAFRIDVGLRPLVGINASWRYRRNYLALQAGTWGPRYLVARATERYEVRPRQFASAVVSFGRREDSPYYGLGGHSERRALARFEPITTRGQLGYQHDLWRTSSLQVEAGARALWFGGGSCCDDPSIRQAVALGRFEAPGLDQDYGASFQRVQFTLDSRPTIPKRGFGLRLSAFEEATFAFAGTRQANEPRRSWVQYGATAGASVDLTGTRRILELQANVAFSDPLQGQVPFTDQIALGGDELMPGFLRGRLVDRSALVVTSRYTWPFWTFLDGTLQAAVGNVFGHQLHDLDVRSLRYSAAIGLRTKGAPSSRLEALFAVGSTPFDEGGKIDSVRFLIGTQHGL